MKIGLIGQSHMGIIASACLASLGHEVVSIDSDRLVTARLNQLSFPISEPGLEELARLHASRITYTNDFSLLRDCPLVFLVKDTPTDKKNASDTAALFDLVDKAAPDISDGAVFVSMSQLPIGFSRKLLSFIIHQRKSFGGARSFFTWVETLVIGDAIRRFLEPERIIIGAQDPKEDLPAVLKELIDAFNCPVLKMSFESAELAKAAINLYLASSVTFANTLADLCEATGADIDEIIPALQLDRRIGKYAYLRPGLGIGGGNLERDLVMLAEQGGEYPFIRTILEYNRKRMGWLEEKLKTLLLSKTKFPTVVLWGLAYKKNTASLKNAPSIQLIARLRRKAKIRAYDPLVHFGEGLEGVIIEDDKYKALEGADCLVVLTDCDEFAAADINKIRSLMRRPLIVDCAKALRYVDELRAAISKVEYHSIGN